MTGRPPSTTKSNRKREIGLFLSDDKMGRSVYNAPKHYINGVIGIDCLVYGEQIFEPYRTTI
jgi:hypothetical protein